MDGTSSRTAQASSSSVTQRTNGFVHKQAMFVDDNVDVPTLIK
jgi:hypothetical protein